MKAHNHILIIEDNPGDALLLKLQLQNLEFSMDCVVSMELLTDAVNYLKSNSPQLIFLDLNLSESNGLETLFAIQATAPAIPVIILSGLNDTALSVQAVKTGAQDYLIKGEFDEKILLKTMLYSAERKKNQLLLEESNKRFIYASKATNDPLWDLDIKTGEIFWNDKVSVFGYSEALPKNLRWKQNNIHPDDKEKVIAAMELLKNQNGEYWQAEYRFRCANGTYLYIHDRAYIIRDSQGKPLRITGTMQDITEKVLLQKKAAIEKELEQKSILKTAIEIQEKERYEISWGLNENINQLLAAALMKLEFIQFAKTDKINHLIQDTKTLLLKSIDETKKIYETIETSKFNHFGLVTVIDDICYKLNKEKDIFIDFKHNIAEIPADHLLSLTIFRIVQEQLNNIIQNHPEVTKASIEIKINGEYFLLNITDNRQGDSEQPAENNIFATNINNRVLACNGQVNFKRLEDNRYSMMAELPLKNELPQLI